MVTRVAIVASHPIQHFAPLYRELAKQPELKLKVFFCSRIGLEPYRDPDFGVEFRWETNLVDGYESEFLANATTIKRLGFWTVHSPDLGERLQAFEPDVVQVYGYAHRLALETLVWCQRNGVATLLMSDSELIHSRPMKVRAAKRIALPLLNRTVNGFLTIGDNNEAYLHHYGVSRQRMFRSPYPTDENLFLEVRKQRDRVRSETRRRLGIHDDAFVALFVGKLIARKRPQDLLRAVQQARAARPMVALFAGDGELRGMLEALAGPEPANVRFAGFVNQGELPCVYAAADVIAHPADRDPHPIAVNEGVLMGLPAVVSDRVGSVGPTDTVRICQNGLVFRPGDVSGLAAALDTLASDSVLYRRMSDASLRVSDEMNLQASVRGYLAAVRAVRRVDLSRSDPSLARTEGARGMERGRRAQSAHDAEDTPG